MRAKVIWFRNGYGFAKTDTGGDVFLHQSAIINMPGYRNLFPNEEIEFDIVSDNPKGPQAINITLISEREERSRSFRNNIVKKEVG